MKILNDNKKGVCIPGTMFGFYTRFMLEKVLDGCKRETTRDIFVIFKASSWWFHEWNLANSRPGVQEHGKKCRQMSHPVNWIPTFNIKQKKWRLTFVFWETVNFFVWAEETVNYMTDSPQLVLLGFYIVWVVLQEKQKFLGSPFP